MPKMLLDVELADGTTYEDLAITNRCMVEYDFERNKLQWPKAEDSPFLWLTYLAYRQLVHNGVVESTVKFKTFREDMCVDIDRKGKDKTDAPELDPTQQAQEPGSASP